MSSGEVAAFRRLLTRLRIVWSMSLLVVDRRLTARRRLNEADGGYLRCARIARTLDARRRRGRKRDSDWPRALATPFFRASTGRRRGSAAPSQLRHRDPEP